MNLQAIHARAAARLAAQPAPRLQPAGLANVAKWLIEGSGISHLAALAGGQGPHEAKERTDSALAAAAWTDADISAYSSRHARLLRWGWAEAEAERMAERLVIRDREADSRVSCTECRHYSPGRCSNHRRACLQSSEVGRDLAALLQRCPGFQVER